MFGLIPKEEKFFQMFNELAGHIVKGADTFVFYYLAFGVCFTLAFLVDRYWVLTESALGKKV